MMYHAALPQQKQLRRQLFIVAVDLADHIASIRGRGRSGRFRDLIVAIVGLLFFIDQRPLNIDRLDLLLEDIGIGADLSQLITLSLIHISASLHQSFSSISPRLVFTPSRGKCFLSRPEPVLLQRNTLYCQRISS